MIPKLELRRQLFHLFMGFFLVFMLHFEHFNSKIIFLILISGIMISLISRKIRIPLISYCLNLFDREKDKKVLPGKGVIFFFVGVLISIELFSKDIALASIMILSLGDSLSHLIGRRYGKIKNVFKKNSEKVIEGTVAGILTGFLGALIFVSPIEAFFASFVAMAAELVEMQLGEVIVDDNLLIPLIAGTTIVVMRTFV